MDEIRCKKCGLWLERPDSICPRCIAIDGGEEEKRKFYKNMDEHSIENAHISSIKKVAETLLRDGQHYIINPREIINIINMLEDAMATQIPPDSGAIRELGTRLVDLLDEDDWNNLEPFLLKAKGAQIELEAEITRLTAENASLREEAALYQKEWAILREEVERLKAAAKGRGMVSEMADMAEVAVLVCGMYDRCEQAEAEVERLRAENAQLKCNFAPILHFARQEQEKRGEPSVVIDSEGIPIENAVLRRNYITLRSQLERAERELAECKFNLNAIKEEVDDPDNDNYFKVKNIRRIVAK